MRELTINEIQAISGGLPDVFYQSLGRALLFAGAGATLIHYGDLMLETCSSSLTSSLAAFTFVTVGTCFVAIGIVGGGLLAYFAFD